LSEKRQFGDEKTTTLACKALEEEIKVGEDETV